MRDKVTVQQSVLKDRFIRGVGVVRCMTRPPLSEGNDCPNAFGQHERIGLDQKSVEGCNGARYCESQCERRAAVFQCIANHHRTDRQKTNKFNHRVCTARHSGRIRRNYYSYMIQELIRPCRSVSALKSAREQSGDVQRRLLPFRLCSRTLAGARKFHLTSAQVIEHRGQTEWPEHPVGKKTEPAHFSLVWG